MKTTMKNLKYPYHLLSAALIVLATVALGATLANIEGPIRIVSGIALSWFAPGYFLLIAIISREMEIAERITLSISASFIISIFAGLLLDACGFLLDPKSIVFYEWSITLVFCVAAYIRLYVSKDSAEAANSHLTSFTDIFKRLRPRLGSGVMTILIATLFLGGSIAWSADSIVAAAQPQPKPFTALSVENGNLVVANYEGHNSTYRVELRDGSTTTQVWNNISLDDRQSWTATLTNDREVFLYRSGSNIPYRHISAEGK